MHRQIPAVVLILVTSNLALAQYCGQYNSSDITQEFTMADRTHHLGTTGDHHLTAATSNKCTYTDTGGEGQTCTAAELQQGFGLKYESGQVTDPGGHELTPGYPPVTARLNGKTTTTAPVEFAVQSCGLLGCPLGALFTWPPFVVVGNNVIFKQVSTASDFCLAHYNIPKKQCLGGYKTGIKNAIQQCGTPLMADLSEVFGKRTDGNDIDHLTDRAHGVSFKFKRGQGQDWADVKPEAIGWTERGSFMAVLIRPDANGDYLIATSDNIFGNYSTCANGKLCNNGVEALRFYCDDPINSGNGDGVCDRRDRNFAKLRWQVGRTKLLTMQQAGVEVFRLDATVMKGKYERTDQFGNVFKIRSTMHYRNYDRDTSLWDVIPDQQGME